MMTFPYRAIPGKSVSVVIAFEPGSANDPGCGGFTLAALRQRLGGVDSDVQHPLTGEKHHISLQAFEQSDHPNMRYIVRHRFVPDKPLSQASLKLIKAYEEQGKATLANGKK